MKLTSEIALWLLRRISLAIMELNWVGHGGQSESQGNDSSDTLHGVLNFGEVVDSVPFKLNVRAFYTKYFIL